MNAFQAPRARAAHLHLTIQRFGSLTSGSRVCWVISSDISSPPSPNRCLAPSSSLYLAKVVQVQVQVGRMVVQVKVEVGRMIVKVEVGRVATWWGGWCCR